MTEPATRQNFSPPPAPSLLGDTLASRESKIFNRAIKVSLIAHCVIFVASLISSLVLRGTPKAYVPSVRVDLVGLPDLKKTDAKEATATNDDIKKKLAEITEKEKDLAAKTKENKVKEAAAEESDMALKNKKEAATPKERKEKLQSAIDRIKALQAIENSVESAKAPAKGNVLSKGTSLVGEQGGDTDVYIDELVTKIRSRWKLPVWLAKQKLAAKVVVYLRRSGGIERLEFVQPSGNEMFDQNVRQAIEGAAPFPPPPSEVESDGILLGFPL